jgi:hypothetical protein
VEHCEVYKLHKPLTTGRMCLLSSDSNNGYIFNRCRQTRCRKSNAATMRFASLHDQVPIEPLGMSHFLDHRRVHSREVLGLTSVDTRSRFGFSVGKQTSRYHRTIAEPYLYGELTFSDQQHASISLLFNTILDRRELAGRIRSFTLANKEHTNTFPSTHSPTSLWPRLAKVKLLLEEFVPLSSSSSSSPRLLAKRWLQQLLAYAPVIDGKVAMIICLAKEINDITLSTRLLEMPITRIVIGWPWIEVDAIAEEDHLTPPTLEIYDSSTYLTQLYDPFTRHSSPPLTDATDNGKKEREQAIQRRDTYRMKQMDDRNAPYPFHKLKRLSIHDPKGLASYKSIHRCGYPRRLFYSFKSLCSLTTLNIDDELIDLNYRSLLIHILTSQVLPTSLQSLSITSICCVRLAQLCRKHSTGE